MSLIDAGHQRSLSPIALFAERLARFATPVWSRRREDGFREDLERIASSAPHLLMDIGFARDTKASTPAETIWRSGSICLAISAHDGTVSVFQN